MSAEHQFCGVHVVGEFYGIERDRLNDPSLLEKLLTEGIAESGATLCSLQTKQFEPEGVTVLGLLSESHASIHTYPSEGSLFFDAFTCGLTCEPIKIARVVSLGLDAQHTEVKTLRRGQATPTAVPRRQPSPNPPLGAQGQ